MNSEALTLNELRELDGERVWAEGGDWNCWAMVKAPPSGAIVLSYADMMAGWQHLERNGVRCYREKPVGAEETSNTGEHTGSPLRDGAEEPGGHSLTIEELRELEGQYVWVAGKRWNCWGTVHCSSDHDPDPSIRTDKERDSAFNLMVQGADFYRSPPEGEPKVSRHRELCLRLNDIYRKKNHDYGDSFGQTFRLWGPAAAGVRMADKLNRFVALSKAAAEVKDESVVDTLLDLANYAIMTVLELEGEG